ncbi:choice-of-anchor D domain-containing protein [Flavobacterium filum]|uniref:choice-of-anchor D domain-containing protein n=1 Tax=Flavobacterium filum TaxID=370974 RepID=UPI0023F1B94B|nr:choice-of-anchor D domain-containing protein [Flavobacterium filum]
MKRYLVVVFFFLIQMSWSQFSINLPSTNYTENFNTLISSSSTTWADNSTLTGWYAATTVTPNTTYFANTGTTATARLNSFGIAATNPINERALGHTTSNAYTGAASVGFNYIGWRLLNNTGAAITAITITYTGEQWRRMDNVNAHNMTVEYRTSSTVTSLTTGTWTSLPALTFTSPQTGATALALDGNAAVNRVADITTTVSVLVYPGEEIMIRWSDINDSGNDHSLAIDDVTVNVTTGPIPPPVITSDLSSSGFIGAAYSFAIIATNSPTSYNAIGLPSGLSVNTSTGLISGTPTVTGTFFITIIATNPSGFDEQTHILTITNPGPEINIRGATGGTNNIISGNIIPNPLNNTLFGSVAIGGSQDKDYRIENIGISLLTLSGTPRVEITGLNAGDFTVITQPSATLNAGANSVFVIRFSPLGGGIRTAEVSILNDDSDENPYTFTIQGNGLAPIINVIGNGNQIINGSATTNLDNHTNFGNVNEAGSTNKIRNFFLVNLGGAVLDINNVTISGLHASDFTISTLPALNVNTNNSTTLSISFNPSALGLREAIVTIDNNVLGNNPFVFAISGVGINFDECALSGLSTIKQQTFEGLTGTTVWNFSTSTALGANPPVITGGVAYGTSRAITSNKFSEGSNSLQVTGPFPSTFDPKPKVIVTFDTVDTSTYSDVVLDLYIGGFSTNGTQGLDVSDWVTVFISADGGTNWSREVIVKGSNNSIWGITSGGTTVNNPFKGLNIPYEFQSTGNSVGNGVRFLTLTNLPQTTQFRLKIELDVDRNDEIWTIDNVRLRGRLPLSSTFLNATSTWSPGPPTSTTRAIFAGNYNTALHGNVTACECLINPTRTVTVTSGSFLEIGGRITNNGTLNVQNGGSVIQKDDYAVNAGNNVTVSKATVIKRLDYVYWSSPVENFPLLSVSPGTSASLHFKWNPTIGGNFGNWQVANENMVRGKGYIIRAPNAYTSTPAPFSTNFVGRLHNGYIPVDISRGNYTGGGYPSPTNPLITVTADDDNFNLIGNPYPSAISALDFLTDNTNIEGSVRLWTHGFDPALLQNDPFYGNFAYNYDPNDYIIYNGTMTVSGPSGFAGYIASGQSFFVLMNDGPQITEQVIFKNSLRSATYDNSQFYKPAPAKQATQGVSDLKIWLDIVSSTGRAVRTGVGYVDGATNDKDRLYDASTKLDGTTKLYSLINNKPFVIQGRALPHSLEDQVELGFFTAQAGMYSIAIGALQPINSSVPVFLEDKLLGITHNLRESPYQFTAAIGVADDRFVLKFANETLNVNPISSLDNDIKIISADNGVLHIKSFQENIEQVQLFDLLGRNVLNKNAIKQQEIELNLLTTKQAVLIKIELENGQLITRKVFLK